MLVLSQRTTLRSSRQASIQSVVLDIREDEPLVTPTVEIPAHLLPNYVLQDKEDIKNSIHNILGTPSQFRGDEFKA